MPKLSITPSSIAPRAVLAEESFEANFSHFLPSKIATINWEIINKIFMEFSIKQSIIHRINICFILT